MKDIEELRSEAIINNITLDKYEYELLCEAMNDLERFNELINNIQKELNKLNKEIEELK